MIVIFPMVYLLLILSGLLFLSHSIFYFRGIFYIKRTFTPTRIDKLSRNLSLILLIPTLTTASILLINPYIKLLVWLPVLLIIISNFNYRVIKKNPYLLPTLNFIFISSIFILSIKEVV